MSRKESLQLTDLCLVDFIERQMYRRLKQT